MADTKQTDAARAEQDARNKEQAASEARAKADAGDTSPAEKKAVDSEQKADDARAKAEQAKREEGGKAEPSTVEEAKVHAPVPPDMPAGHHRAQRIGVDPANPKPARGEHEDPELQTERLQRWSPDAQADVFTNVHPEMVGDYLRAGWSRVA